jgi:hypothetical protein
MKQVQSPNLLVCGELIWSRVSPNRASGPGFIQTHYSLEVPKSLLGELLEMDKASGVICFPLCARKEDPLLPLHNPHPFHFCLCLHIW